MPCRPYMPDMKSIHTLSPLKAKFLVSDRDGTDADPRFTYRMSINQFTDLTPTDMISLDRRAVLRREATVRHEMIPTDAAIQSMVLPKSVDWRERDPPVVTP